MTGRRSFRDQMREELLERYPDWQETSALWGRRAPRRRRTRWPLAAAALAMLLAAAPVALRSHRASGPVSRARLMSWPAGFTLRAQVSLGAGRLLLFQGHRVRCYVAGQLGRLQWVASLPQSESVMAAAAGWRGETLLLVQQGQGAWVQVRGAHGQLLRALDLRLADAAPAGPWTVRSAGAPGWVVSDRARTWLVRLDGRLQGPLEGGSGSLAVAERPGVQDVAAWSPTQRTLYLYGMSGRLLYRVPEPALEVIGAAPGVLVPTAGADGFAIGWPGGYAVPYVVGGTVEPQGLMPAGLATPAGVLAATGGRVRLIVWHGPFGATLPPLSFGPRVTPVAFLTVPSVLVGTRAQNLEALSSTGHVLVAKRVGRVAAVGAGARFLYAATRGGLVQLGPFAPAQAVGRPRTWREIADGYRWSASLTMWPLSGWPTTEPYSSPSISVPPGVPILATQDDPMRATVRLTYIGGGSPTPATVAGKASVGGRTWFFGGPERTRVWQKTSTVAVPVMAWIGVQDGWLSTSALGARVSFAVEGPRRTAASASQP